MSQWNSSGLDLVSERWENWILSTCLVHACVQFLAGKRGCEVRKKEAETYRATHQDYTESLDALSRAINVLRKQSFDRAQAALTQVRSPFTELDSLVIAFVHHL